MSKNGKVAVPVAMPKQNSVGAVDADQFAADFKNSLKIDTNTNFQAGLEGISPLSRPGKLQASAAPFEPGHAVLAPIDMLNKGSVPDEAYHTHQTASMPTIARSSADGGGQFSSFRNGAAPVTEQAPVGTRSNTVNAPPSTEFTTDFHHEKFQFTQGSHYVRVANVAASSGREQYEKLVNDCNFKSKILAQKIAELDSSELVIYLCLDDLKDCHHFKHAVRRVAEVWAVSFINRGQWDSVSNYSPFGSCDYEIGRFAGQANLQAVPTEWTHFSQCTTAELPTVAYQDALQLAQSYGSVQAFTKVQSSISVINFRVEFCKWSDARNLVECVTTAQPFKGHNAPWSIVASDVFEETHAGASEFQVAPSTPHRATAAGVGQFCSPTGRSAWRTNSKGETEAVPMSGHPTFHSSRMSKGPQQFFITPPRWSSAPNPSLQQDLDAFDNSLGYTGRSASYPVHGTHGIRYSDSEPNQVSVQKISQGLDVRTTVMLRNLPNRWTWQNLKSALDQTSRGLYDFSYLRIDFERSTNVGYAFVNFTDPVHIIDFVERWVDNEWAPHSAGPRKYAAVSYATIQGFDCLVAKFRNSAIMDEFPGYRPKLWFTKDTADHVSQIGTEMQFPASDNRIKKQRSADNAGQIGLFGPRSGQRSGDRNRRSHWDRGTTRQIQEDAAYYNQYAPYYGGPVQQPPIGPPSHYYSPYGAHPGNTGPHAGHVDNFGYYQQPPPPFYPGGGYQWPPPPPFHGYPGGYPTNNPGSFARTMSGGRLAGRPRLAIEQPGTEDLFTGPSRGGSHATAVPRSFGSADGQEQFQNGEGFVSADRDHVQNGQTYLTH